MKYQLATVCVGIGICLAGCAGRRPVPPPQTAAVRASGRIVSERLESASSRARTLHKAVPIDLQPAVEQLQEDLLQATEAKLAQDKAVETLERDVTLLVQQRDEFAVARDAALTSRNRWRRYTAWTGTLALAMAVWIFRKPLMRLTGIPL